ncbi:Flagellar regulatory protein FleQ [Sandaracinus amylolyticus]|uniref:Flagellar regulatory protein FleQ n=2 Tax=Sandaracinus amylolyticus TaxID=927083 RepID=A0A0F6W9H2_9BACT|nr:Flagellar regulatory protein FleQ [Sandaracinus amylolyticus]
MMSASSAWSLGWREDDLAARFPRVIGRSERTNELRRQLAAAAGCDATVLLRGESGTGKEVAAWSIHEASERRRGPMVVVDCSAIASELIESELFGHERGAFTGALGPRAGLFETASGGTIFLDEIGELPLAMQPKLLRVLESRTVRRVGGQKNVAIDVRVVCATHRDLRAEVRAGRFREDLYFRLAVLSVELPALRARREDVPLLIEHFLQQQSASAAAVMARIARERRHELLQHAWPGNVRELRNHVERCAAFGRWVPLDGDVEPELAREEPSGEHRVAAILGVDGSKAYADEKQKWVSLFERAYLEELLRVHDDNVKAAARTAGIDRAYLYRLLHRHALR